MRRCGKDLETKPVVHASDGEIRHEIKNDVPLSSPSERMACMEMAGLAKVKSGPAAHDRASVDRLAAIPRRRREMPDMTMGLCPSFFEVHNDGIVVLEQFVISTPAHKCSVSENASIGQRLGKSFRSNERWA